MLSLLRAYLESPHFNLIASLDRKMKSTPRSRFQSAGAFARFATLGVAGLALAAASHVMAAPVISRLTPPSGLFSFGDPQPPIIARFLPDQRFDLQITVTPDAGQTINNVKFYVNNIPLPGTIATADATVAGISAGSKVYTLRAFSLKVPGVHQLRAVVRQTNGQTSNALGNFEIVNITRGIGKVKNVIFCIGDGMGIGHRTAARIMLNGVQQGKALDPLAMDTFPVTGLVTTGSLNSIITDSSPGAACYSSGNKANNNQQGVFPDDTTDKFDNPRVELIGEYLARTEGKALGIVTTADVFDATPGAFGTHTQDRGAGTGICDQFLDEAVVKGNLRVLMGGGRKWFLPNTTAGSARSASSDYVLPTDLTTAWGVAPGVVDPARDLIAGFQGAGFSYASDLNSLNAVPANAQKLLGLFTLSNMNVAKDKIDGRRGASTVVNDYGFPNQPMLDEMTGKALTVLSKNANGFVLMVEGASIDKQAHNMDSERWILETIEFDRAIARCKQFAQTHGNTLVIVTADHECAGVNIIGASTVTNAVHANQAANAGGVAGLRNNLVGIYEAANFPQYLIGADGYPVSTDVDYKMLIGYAGNADRYEDWLTNPKPLRDSQQPFNNSAPLNTYPSGPISRDVAGNFLVTGQVPGSTAVHTASDIPLSAYGPSSQNFTGVMDNTDVFFRAMQAVLGGERPDPFLEILKKLLGL